MDFHTLARRDLQALCKKNQIPANLSNLAMADALQALHSVEGIEEFLSIKSSVDGSDETREQQASPFPHSRRVSAKASDVKLLELDGEIDEAVSIKKPPGTSRRASARTPCARRNISDGVTGDEAITTATAVTRSRRRRAGNNEERSEGMREKLVEIVDTSAPRTSRRNTARKVVVEENKEELSRMTTRRTRQSAKVVVDVAASATSRRSTRITVKKMQSLASEEDDQKAEKDFKDEEAVEYNENFASECYEKSSSLIENVSDICDVLPPQEIGDVGNVSVQKSEEAISDEKQCEMEENVPKICSEQLKENVMDSDGISNVVATNEEALKANGDALLITEISEEKKEEVDSVLDARIVIEMPVEYDGKIIANEVSEEPCDIVVEVVDQNQHVEKVEDIEVIIEKNEGSDGAQEVEVDKSGEEAAQNNNVNDFCHDQEKTAYIENFALSEGNEFPQDSLSEEESVEEEAVKNDNINDFSYDKEKAAHIENSALSEGNEFPQDNLSEEESVDKITQEEGTLSELLEGLKIAGGVPNEQSKIVEGKDDLGMLVTAYQQLVATTSNDVEIVARDAKSPTRRSGTLDADKENQQLVGAKLGSEANEKTLDYNELSIRKLKYMVKEKLTKNQQVEIKRTALASLNENRV